MEQDKNDNPMDNEPVNRGRNEQDTAGAGYYEKLYNDLPKEVVDLLMQTHPLMGGAAAEGSSNQGKNSERKTERPASPEALPRRILPQEDPPLEDDTQVRRSVRAAGNILPEGPEQAATNETREVQGAIVRRRVQPVAEDSARDREEREKAVEAAIRRAEEMRVAGPPPSEERKRFRPEAEIETSKPNFESFEAEAEKERQMPPPRKAEDDGEEDLIQLVKLRDPSSGKRMRGTGPAKELFSGDAEGAIRKNEPRILQEKREERQPVPEGTQPRRNIEPREEEEPKMEKRPNIRRTADPAEYASEKRPVRRTIDRQQEELNIPPEPRQPIRQTRERDENFASILRDDLREEGKRPAVRRASEDYNPERVRRTVERANDREREGGRNRDRERERAERGADRYMDEEKDRRGAIRRSMDLDRMNKEATLNQFFSDNNDYDDDEDEDFSIGKNRKVLIIGLTIGVCLLGFLTFKTVTLSGQLSKANEDLAKYVSMSAELNQANIDKTALEQELAQYKSSGVAPTTPGENGNGGGAGEGSEGEGGTEGGALTPNEGETGEFTTYTVVSGDSYWGIAQKVYNDGSQYKRILEANGLSESNALKLGQTLKIPK